MQFDFWRYMLAEIVIGSMIVLTIMFVVFFIK